MEYKKGDIVVRTHDRGYGNIAKIVQYDGDNRYLVEILADNGYTQGKILCWYEENFRIATKLEKLLNGL